MSVHAMGWMLLLASTIYGADTAALKPAVWIEAENTNDTNFLPGAGPANISRQSPGVSGAAFLTLAAKKPDTGELPFYAIWKFQVSSSGVYRLWAGISPQDVDWTSPFLLKCDDGPAISLENRHTPSGVYGPPPRNQFEWIDAGTVTLTEGDHMLRLEAIRPRTSARDDLYHGFADAFFLTQELDYVPKGVYPKYSPHRPWAEVLGDTPLADFILKLQLPFYQRKLAQTDEGFGEDVEQEIERKLMGRALPGPKIGNPGAYEFGVHGMEAPFVRKGVDTGKVQHAYELLARAGVQSLRTAESGWHRLGRSYDNFTELDYQVDSAARYGMTQMFTVGYPPYPYSVARQLSAVRPEYVGMYQDYLKTVLQRYAARGVIRGVELANEVDALNPWWVDSTPEMYVREMHLVKNAVEQYAPNALAVAFAATYGRNEVMGGRAGGRRFIRRCFDLGIDTVADAYSLHYTWQLTERDFPAFFRREALARNLPEKPLINSEETSHGPPSDLIKLFARDFLLYGMKRVDYFMSKDWFELGTCKVIGLFDLQWKPKRRLLAYAAAVDAIQHRQLVGMSEPVPGAEAYVLRWVGEGQAPGAEYATIIWKEGTPTMVRGWMDYMRAIDWKLDDVSSTTGSVEVGEKPIIVFSKSAPTWGLITPAQWLERVRIDEGNIAPIVPQ
ncbi:MAG: hypothetical protein WC205_02985 [Opitutaceae bacterium]